ncbi:MAG TPA: glycine--tRNA ligase subunit beta [Bryobacteraceae bacterium]|jgi:glycyl-tRNA synthetase beta chain|nr:glycine--tRNA ligase subunit beta [Bryobacteraceae bacterium]
MNFLLEIGTEEIPHWMIPSALAQLEKLDLFGATPKVDATPRRLVVRAEGLPDRTPDQEQLVKGPPISAGEKAALGFAKKQGVDLSAMQKAGDYYELRKKIQGRPVRDLLAESLPTSILGIQWPKTMYWGAKGSPRFIRPIRWIVALLGDEIIPFEIAGVKSGDTSRGHRILGKSQIKVDYGSVERELRANKVILGAAERRNKIETEAKSLGATLDPDLVETLTYITEYPAAIKGDFDPAYLQLPAEVLTTVMRHHQKYFAVETNPGVLAPHFVAVMNIPADPDGEVKKGNERVLKARFNDARFFWEVDQKKKLADRVEDLSHVTFQAKLGTYLEKTHRVVALVKELGGDENAQRAALLSKADLTTEMVKEFTDLQGIVGGLYAKAQGEPEAVSKAIYEHYKPLSMEDSIPSTTAGQILAIADKLDNLREFFRIDMVPTGSKDPFALRRAAQGIVKMLVEAKLPYPLKSLMDNDFMRERIQYYFREIQGFKYDEVNAVMASEIGALSNLEERLKWLARVRQTPDFEPLAASFKRINNILKQANFKPNEKIEIGLLEEGPERELYETYWQTSFETLAESISTLRPVVDRFFDKVMVNVPDEKLRANRLTLLHNLLLKFSTIADFSEIVTSGDQK